MLAIKKLDGASSIAEVRLAVKVVNFLTAQRYIPSRTL
jgi:hypothetical protein